MLPTKPTPPKVNMSDLSVLIYGDPKWGKSSFCSHAEKALFIATEPGLNHLEVFQVPVKERQLVSGKDDEGNVAEKEMCGWEYIKYTYKHLLHKDHGFKTVVFDTIDVAYDHCYTYVCKKNGWESADKDISGDKLGWGEGWRAINDEFKTVLRRFQELGMGMYLVSHSVVREVDSRVTSKKTTPTLPGGARKAVLAMSDIVMYATSNADGRLILTKNHATYEAGDRTERLPEKFQVPNGDTRLSETYNTFKKAIRGSK